MKPSQRHLALLSRWGGLSLSAALLCACSSTPLPPTEGEPPASAVSAPSAASAAASASTAQVEAVTTAVITPQVLSTPGDADSYSARDDARALARDIAQAHELDEAWVWSALSAARYKSQAARLMMPAPRGTAKNWGVYRSRFIEPIRIRAGIAFWQQYQAELQRAQAQYGVPAEIIAGVIGVETIYGRYTGNFRVLDVLTTLSLDFPTGRSDRSAVFGGMSDVVEHSMQHMSDADLTAIARYLKTLPPSNPNDQPHVYDKQVADALWKGDDSKPGAAVYIDNCAACHRTDGHGYTRVFPALAGNPVVQTADATSLINIVLNGGTLPATHTAPSTFTMPAFAWRLSDQEVADVVSFIRGSWGNKGAPVSAKEVAELRSDDMKTTSTDDLGQVTDHH